MNRNQLIYPVRSVVLGVGLLLLLLSIAAWLPARADSNLELIKIAEGLSTPVYITHAGDGSGRLFIVEKSGVIRILKDGQVLPTPFLDIRDRVADRAESGLLSVAFPPDFEEAGYFFVYYNHDSELAGPEPIDAGNNEGDDTVIARFQVSANPDQALASSEQRILIRSQPHITHNGGLIKFGPDGYLYIGLGDGGQDGDPQNQAQSYGSLLGKVLRIEVGSGGTYTVPADNPFVGNSGARPEIWHLGLRNPWRWSFDRATGDMWIADVGQATLEEVNFASAGQGGLNFGWRCKEGTRDYRPSPPCTGTLTAPVTVYERTLGRSVTGGYVYRGRTYPALQGLYFYGDFTNGRIWSMRNVNGTWSEPAQEMDTELSIASFGEDEDGELFVVDMGGSIYRMVSNSSAMTNYVYLPFAAIDSSGAQ